MLVAVLALGGCGGNDGNPSDAGVTSVSGQPQPGAARCGASSALAVLTQGRQVSAYVPKGAWYAPAATTGIARVGLEGRALAATMIDTPEVVNSCASNSTTGRTVCIANDTDVYILLGSNLDSTLKSAGSGVARFSGGVCTNCTVAFDAEADRAVIGLNFDEGQGFQFLDFANGSPMLESPIASPTRRVGENLLIDSRRRLILSPSEDDDYEIVSLSGKASPTFFENPIGTPGVDVLDSAAEDCTTGIALASDQFTSKIFITDLTQAVFTHGTPSGTWSAPFQFQNFPDFATMINGISGIAIAPQSHLGAVAGEIAGNALGAIRLPAKAGSGVPAIADWVECGIPDDPTGAAWRMGLDPHPLTIYESPDSGHTIAVLANSPAPTFLALVDLTQMIDPTVLARTVGTNTCSDGVLPSSLVRFVALP
jgi:hypothetical protein